MRIQFKLLGSLIWLVEPLEWENVPAIDTFCVFSAMDNSKMSQWDNQSENNLELKLINQFSKFFKRVYEQYLTWEVQDMGYETFFPSFPLYPKEKQVE